MFLGTIVGNAAVTFTVAGTDPEGDIVSLRLIMKDSDGNDVFADMPVPDLDMQEVDAEEDGFYTGRLTATFPADFNAGSVAAVDVRIVDRAGLSSDVFVAQPAAPGPIAPGEACDLLNLSESCAPAGYCAETVAAMDDVPAEYACMEAQTECADGVNTIALEADAAGAYIHVGNTEGNANNGQGNCVEADGDEAVHALTSATGGFFTCEVDVGDEDSVMYARSHCGAQASELACNDDSPVGADGNIGSRVSFYVAPGGTAYVFVDAFFAGDTFDYQLTCSAE
jgi:hypothetical protein